MGIPHELQQPSDRVDPDLYAKRRHNRCGLGDMDTCGHPDCPDMPRQEQVLLAELEDLKRFRREVLRLAVPQWRSYFYVRDSLLNDLRALLGTCDGCGHPDHRAEGCPTTSREDQPCTCRS